MKLRDSKRSCRTCELDIADGGDAAFAVTAVVALAFGLSATILIFGINPVSFC